MVSIIMKHLHYYILAAGMVVLMSACGSKKPVAETAGFSTYETECLGNDVDGLQMLRVYGTGIDEDDAIEQAMKKAVSDVTFVGISGGQGECNAYPVVDQANARQKYEVYFNKFFQKGGTYKKYVTLKRKQKKNANSYQGAGTVTMEVVLKVDRPGLKKRYQKDKILQ